jgi:hypothetical protein
MPVLLHLASSAAGKESISRSVGNVVRAEWEGVKWSQVSVVAMTVSPARRRAAFSF